MLFIGLTSISFAKSYKDTVKKFEIIKGPVVSIRSKNDMIVLKIIKTGKKKKFFVPHKRVDSLKEGDTIYAKVKTGTRVIKSLKIVKHKKKQKK